MKKGEVISIITIVGAIMGQLMSGSQSRAQSVTIPFLSQPAYVYDATPNASGFTMSAISSTDYLKGMPYYQALLPPYRSSGSTLYPSAGWLNHPPVPVYTPSLPMVMKAGQSSSWDFWVMDPDAEGIYVSSTTGSTGQYGRGTFAWGFSPTFPGVYMVDTVAYDERGGFAYMRYPVNVKPWWSF